jgi:hypothetical protein
VRCKNTRAWLPDVLTLNHARMKSVILAVRVVMGEIDMGPRLLYIAGVDGRDVLRALRNRR